ncbi:MAG: hypothetical protein WCI01_07005 [Chlorobiaceae bacterium]
MEDSFLQVPNKRFAVRIMSCWSALPGKGGREGGEEFSGGKMG